MSTRAYAFELIIHDQIFNLWHDKQFVEAAKQYWEDRREDEYGEIIIWSGTLDQIEEDLGDEMTKETRQIIARLREEIEKDSDGNTSVWCS